MDSVAEASKLSPMLARSVEGFLEVCACSFFDFLLKTLKRSGTSPACRGSACQVSENRVFPSAPSTAPEHHARQSSVDTLADSIFANALEKADLSGVIALAFARPNRD